MRRIALLMVLLMAAAVSASAASTWPVPYQRSWIAGRVTVEGKPLANVQVTAVGQHGMALARSSADGSYALGVGEGEWTVMATATGYSAGQPQQVKLAAGEANEKIDIQLTKSNAFIKGQVVDEAGKPLGNSHVAGVPMPVSTEDGETPDATDFLPCGATADAQGRFTLPARKGFWLVSAFRSNYEMSPKNPAPSVPGMPNVPGLTGVGVPLAEGQTVDGVVVVLRPAVASQKPGGYSVPDKPQDIPHVANVLVGRALLSPNNVLHWTRSKDRDKQAFYVIERWSAPGAKGEMKKFEYTATPYGMPGHEVFSFTDSTAVPGKTYWYAVYELGVKGPGPKSNVVEIKTR